MVGLSSARPRQESWADVVAPPQYQEARSYDPTWRDSVAIWLQRQMTGGQDQAVSRSISNLVGSDGLGRRKFAAIDFSPAMLPLLGADVGDAVRRGDRMEALLGVAGAVAPWAIGRYGGRLVRNTQARANAAVDAGTPTPPAGLDDFISAHNARVAAARRGELPTARDAETAVNLAKGIQNSSRASSADSLEVITRPINFGRDLPYDDANPVHVISEIYNRPGLRNLPQSERVQKSLEIMSRYADEYTKEAGAAVGNNYRVAADVLRAAAGQPSAASRALSSSQAPASRNGLQIVNEPSEVLANRAAGGIEMAPPPEWYRAVRQFHQMNKGNSTIHAAPFAAVGAGAGYGLSAAAGSGAASRYPYGEQF